MLATYTSKFDVASDVFAHSRFAVDREQWVDYEWYSLLTEDECRVCKQEVILFWFGDLRGKILHFR